VSYGVPMLKIFTKLEGDGPLIVSTYRRLMRVKRLLDNAEVPDGFEGQIVRLAQLTPTAPAYFQMQRQAALHQAATYFNEQLQKVDAGINARDCLHIARVAAMWEPGRAKFLALDNAMFDQVCCSSSSSLNPQYLLGGVDEPAVRWMTVDIQQRLRNEAAAYKAILAVTDARIETLDFWRHLEAVDDDEVPTWRWCFWRLVLLQPSAACVERVWSLLSNFLSAEDAPRALMDYIELYLILAYNNRKSKPQ
jgi:hypothetical protein